ncbi:MAG: sigma-54-dependent Fis family transcriptional regulator [Bacteroidia bacterium]|nr:sigma-54-dependent Fis family transcriptional regulator [Bacteroidia bacterium]
MSSILVIDDDLDICLLLEKYLSKHGFDVSTSFSGGSALENISKKMPDIILSDFRLQDMLGSDLLKEIKSKNPSVPVIIMTGYSDVRTAVNIMKLGAFDYVTKPLLPEEILLTLRRALASVKTEDATQAKEATKNNLPKDNIQKTKYVFGNSPVFNLILKQIDLVAPTNYSVIIYGESGSGKESVANEIHNRSSRAAKPFVAIDCGSLSRELAASELFGHEKGSFTGAHNQKTGSFELANGGTVFLDEIGNLSYDIQVALLRVVQERKMRRVGGLKDIELDVRIIVASNERLSEAARKGKFREDLYHRFNEFSIEVPALRNRQEDILMFALFFLKKTNEELNKAVSGFSEEVKTIFLNYYWPGNLRELNNVIKRSTLLTSGSIVEISALPPEIINYKGYHIDGEENAGSDKISSDAEKDPLKRNHDFSIKHASIDAEYELISEALKKCNHNKSKAARLLKIDRKTLYNKMKQYNDLKNGG